MSFILVASAITGFNTVNNIPKVKSFKFVGSTKPIENFDPLNLLKDKSENRIKFTREAELQHGRVAMLASFIIPSIELLDKSSDDTLGINYLANMDIVDQIPFWVSVALYETNRMNNGWVNPFSTNSTFQLKSDYQPGNVLNLDMERVSDDMLNRELNNGRLAMLAVAGQIAQELVTGNRLF
tara:strand:- start:26 stop:571 length:546 start_codon:yes stop_codon:yes gene_type:complete